MNKVCPSNIGLLLPGTPNLGGLVPNIVLWEFDVCVPTTFWVIRIAVALLHLPTPQSKASQPYWPTLDLGPRHLYTRQSVHQACGLGGGKQGGGGSFLNSETKQPPACLHWTNPTGIHVSLYFIDNTILVSLQSKQSTVWANTSPRARPGIFPY